MEKQPLPREIQKWIHSLDLTYKIFSYRRDLANGFIFGEILYKILFYPEDKKYDFNMRNFNTGNSLENRISNWDTIKKMVKIRKLALFKDDVINGIINKSPNVAFNALIETYKVLTNKSDVFLIRKIDEVDKFRQYELDMPLYMNPTMIKMIKDDDIQRIKDYKHKKREVHDIMRKHRKFLARRREKNRNRVINKDQNQLNPELKDNVMSLMGTDKNMDKKANKKTTERETRSLDKSLGDKMDKNEEKMNLLYYFQRDYNNINLKNEGFIFSGYDDNDKNYNVNIPSSYQSNDTIWEQQIVPLSSDYNVEVNFGKIIKKYFIESEHNIELEFKRYVEDLPKEKSKDYVGFLFNKFNLINEEKLKVIFNVLREKEVVNDNFSQDKNSIESGSTAKEESNEVLKIIEIISKTLIELVSFLRIITTFIDLLHKNGFSFDDILHPAIRICKGVLIKDPIRCESIFLNYGIDIILKVISIKPYFRNCMLQLIYSLIINNKYSHLKVLKKIREKFIYDEINYYHILAKWMEFTTPDCIEDNEISEIYFNSCRAGIKSDCDIIKCKSIYMILIFMRLNEYTLSDYKEIFRLKKSYNWEILSLILIYCTHTLKRLNIFKEKKKLLEIYYKKNYLVNEMEAINELEASYKENSNVKESVSINKSEMMEEMNDKSVKLNHNDIEKISDISQLSNNSKNSKNEKALNVEELMELKEQVKIEEEEFSELLTKEDEFLDTIFYIFQAKNPNLTVKIGFIYLAEIIHYYPSLASKYIEILINFKYNKVREEVILASYDKDEMEYTSHCYTEKYRFCGAPNLWKPISIAYYLSKYIKENNLQRLELNHIIIFHAIVTNQEFSNEESEEWVSFFNNLKNFLFLALCETDYSESAVEITKKFIDFKKIRNQILDVRKILTFRFQEML